jgi:hypothetical protein
MVIRLIAVPDSLDLTDFDGVFHAVLGWDAGIGYAFQIQGQEYNSFQRTTRSQKLCDFRLHRQEKFLYTLGALDQWEWEIRVIDLQDGAQGDETPVCVGGRGAAPPQYSGGPTGYPHPSPDPVGRIQHVRQVINGEIQIAGGIQKGIGFVNDSTICKAQKFAKGSGRERKSVNGVPRPEEFLRVSIFGTRAAAAGHPDRR